MVGGRADGTLIRAGAERANVEATFQLSEGSRQPIIEILEREELLDDANFVTLGRELRREGRNIARVNGRTVSLNLLREIGSYLIDIHGQSEHLSLLNNRQHIQLLDRYTGIEAEDREIGRHRFDVVVLDEALVACHLRLLPAAGVRRAVRLAGARGARLVILTGRWAPPALLREADLATELRSVRHPFEKGEKPVHGIDY